MTDYNKEPANPMRYVDEGKTDMELRIEFLGIRSTLERFGEVLLTVFTESELKKAYGPVFEVWYANRKEN